MAGPPKISAPNTATFKKVGHTTGQNHASDPLAKKRGDTSPTEITFGGKNPK